MLRYGLFPRACSTAAETSELNPLARTEAASEDGEGAGAGATSAAARNLVVALSIPCRSTEPMRMGLPVYWEAAQHWMDIAVSCAIGL